MIKQINGPNAAWNKQWFTEMAERVILNKPIEVYKNLHKGCWSVRQGGKVLFHTTYICMHDCRFVVRPAGHAKGIKEQRKNVHAFVRGYLISSRANDSLTEGIEWQKGNVTYNPYKQPHFTCGRYAVSSADVVDMASDSKRGGILAWGITTIDGKKLP